MAGEGCGLERHSARRYVSPEEFRTPDGPFSEVEDGSRHMRTRGDTAPMADTERARTLSGYDERLTELRRYL